MPAATGLGLTAVERCGAVAEQVLFWCRIGQPPLYFNGHVEGFAMTGGAQQICDSRIISGGISLSGNDFGVKEARLAQ